MTRLRFNGAFFAPRRVARALAAIALSVAAFHLMSRRVALPAGELSVVVRSLATLALLLLPLPILLSGRGVQRLQAWVAEQPWRVVVFPAVLLVPCCVYWSIPGAGSAAGVARLLAFIAIPTALAIALPRGRYAIVGDSAVVLSIWIPIELRLMTPAFPWPGGGAGSVLLSPLGLDLLIYLMLVARGFDPSGLTMRVAPRDVASAAGSFAAFAAVGVPIGLHTGFLVYGVRDGAPLYALAGFAVILVFTGLPEEVLFRGFIQSIIGRATGRPILSLVAASVIFGAAHLDNGRHAPDWRYGILATLAGLAYGWVYLRTRRILASALTHTFVDVTWTLFFKGMR